MNNPYEIKEVLKQGIENVYGSGRLKENCDFNECAETFITIVKRYLKFECKSKLQDARAEAFKEVYNDINKINDGLGVAGTDTTNRAFRKMALGRLRRLAMNKGELPK